MKTKFYLSVLLALFLVACGQTTKFTVEGIFTGEYADQFNGKNIKVSIYEGNSLVDLDASAVIENNSFIIKGESPQSTVGYLSYEGMQDKPYAFVIEKGKTKIEIGDAGVQVSGTDMNDAYTKMEHTISSHYGSLEKLMSTLQRILESGRLSADNFESIEADYNRVFSNIEKTVTHFVVENIEHPVAQYALAEYSSYLSPEKVIELVGLFPEGTTSERLNNIKGMAEQKSTISKGKQYIDVEGTDLKGKSVKISDFVGKEEFTLIYFWKSDDVNSQDFLKTLRNLKDRKGLNIVGISLDTDKKAWEDVSKFEKITWAQLSPNDMAQARKDYSVNMLPVYILIYKDGRISESRNVDKLILEGKIIALLDRIKK